MTFEIMTTIVVLAIFGVFYLAAHKAEKVVAAKAKAKLEQQKNLVVTEAPAPKRATKKGNNNQKKNKVIV